MGNSSIMYVKLIDDFGVSVPILLRGTHSGQTSIKCRDLACDVEPPPLKNFKNLTMKLEVKYLYPNSSLGANFYIYQLPEGLEMRKILAHGIRMQKNPQNKRIFSEFLRILIELCGSKVQLAPPHGNFISSVANPEIVYYEEDLNFS